MISEATTALFSFPFFCSVRFKSPYLILLRFFEIDEEFYSDDIDEESFFFIRSDSSTD